MESLRNEPVIFSGTGATAAPYGPGYGYGGSDILSTILAASLLGGAGVNRGYGYQPALVDMGTLLAEKSSSDARRDVKETESEIRESIHDQSHEFRALQTQLASADKEALRSTYENQIATKDSTVALTNKIDCETNSLRTQLGIASTSIDKQFADLKYGLQEMLAAQREKELVERVNRLERENQTDDLVRRIVRQISNPAA